MSGLHFARSGDYSEPAARAMDFQKRYLELAFGFIGFTNIRSLIVQPTIQAGPETAARRTNSAMAEAQALAAGF